MTIRKAVLCCLITFCCFCLFSFPQTVTAQSKGRPLAPATVAPVQQRSVTPILELVGASQANRTSNAAGETSGLVRSMNFHEGDLVRKGDPLVELDKTNLALGLKASQAALAAVKIRLQQARSNLARSTSLKKKNTISQQNYEEDLFEVKKLEQEEAAAAAETARISDSLSRKTIHAPFTGYIIQKFTEVGQWINSGDATVEIMELSPIKVRTPAPEKRYSDIKIGALAEVRFDALPGRIFSGKVVAVIPKADDKSRSFPVELIIDNPDLMIKAGMTARVVLRGPARTMLLAPKDALVLNQDKTSVFTVKNGVVKAVEVETGQASGGDIEIFADIKPGDLVVVQGNERLRDGQKIRPINLDEPEPAEKNKP